MPAPAPPPVVVEEEEEEPKVPPEELLAIKMGMSPKPVDPKVEGLMERSASIEYDPKMKEINVVLKSHKSEVDIAPPCTSPGGRRSESLRTGGCGLVDRRMKELERNPLPSLVVERPGLEMLQSVFNGTPPQSPLFGGWGNSPFASAVAEPASCRQSVAPAHRQSMMPSGPPRQSMITPSAGGRSTSVVPRQSVLGVVIPGSPNSPTTPMSPSGETRRSFMDEELANKDAMEEKMRSYDFTSFKHRYRDHTDKTVKRLMIDMELARDDRQKHYSHQTRCDHLDKMHSWYNNHTLKEHKKERKAPPYLSFSQEGPVSPGSTRVQFKEPSPLLSTLRKSGSSPALLA